jgi:hypothetical protein
MLYIAIFVLNVLDLAFTHVAVNILGYQELNPIMAPIVGSWVIIPIKLGLAGLAVYLLWRANGRCVKWPRAPKIAAWIVFVFYILVVLNNGLILILELYLLRG